MKQLISLLIIVCFSTSLFAQEEQRRASKFKPRYAGTSVNTRFMWTPRAMAVALEQENKAKIHEARAKVTLAEAEVPLAMAEAFRNGNLGIMDYYRMKNIEADTAMRESIGKPAAVPNKPVG